MSKKNSTATAAPRAARGLFKTFRGGIGGGCVVMTAGAQSLLAETRLHGSTREHMTNGANINPFGHTNANGSFPDNVEFGT